MSRWIFSIFDWHLWLLLTFTSGHCSCFESGRRMTKAGAPSSKAKWSWVKTWDWSNTQALWFGDAILTKSFELQRVIGTISVYNRMYTRLVAFSIPVLVRKNHKVAQDLPWCLLNDSDDISRKMASHVFPIQQPWQDHGRLYNVMPPSYKLVYNPL